MKFQFTKDTFLFIFAILPGMIVFSLFVNVSPAHAWASAFGYVRTSDGYGVICQNQLSFGLRYLCTKQRRQKRLQQDPYRV